MATRLQPRLALLIEKKRQELETAIRRADKILARMQGSLGSDADLMVACVDDFHRECRAISRLWAELQFLESVAKAAVKP
ncbi:MAG: hypothetical protein ACREEM_51720 [Blastocatellia bacterium]